MKERDMGNLEHVSGYNSDLGKKVTKLAYTKEFRELQGELLPHFKIVLSLMDRAWKEYTPSNINPEVEADGIRVKAFNLARLDHPPSRPAMGFKVSIGDQSFFVKVQNNSRLAEGGTNEIINGEEAKKLLADVPGVKVADYQLGYSSGKKNYLVTKWLDLPTVAECLKSLTVTRMQRRDDITCRMSRIAQILSLNRFYDVKPHNMFYDEKSDTIILFDLSKLQTN